MSSGDGMDRAAGQGPSRQQPTLALTQERLAEAARYAVLGRLSPMLRHDMAGALQPLRMISAMLQRRLEAAVLDRVAIAKNVSAIDVLSKEAAAHCMGAMNWLVPINEDSVSVQAGVQELLTLTATELFLHGLVGVNAVPDAEARFPRTFFRSIFAAALLALCDSSDGAASVHVELLNLNGDVDLHLRVARDALAPAAQPVQRQRRLDWDDVRVLAAAAGLAFAQGEEGVSLRLPPESATGA